jgi:GTPase SAR1 family protein
VKTWLESIYLHADPNIVKVLVGNKIDLEDERKVSTEDAMNLASQHKMMYFETSAKLNKNIDELMQHLMENVY